MTDPAAPEPGKPKHDPGSSGFWWIPGGMLFAAAMAIFAWWIVPPSADVRALTEAKPKPTADRPLPDYVLATDGGLTHVGEPGETDNTGRHHYRRDTRFEWILRPKADEFGEPGEVGVRGFAFVDGGSAGLGLAALGELIHIAGSGEIQIRGTIEQLDLEPGRYTVALAVGRPAGLPSQAADVWQPSVDATWQVRRIDVEIED